MLRSTVEEWFGNQSLYIAELLVDSGSRGQGMGSLLTCASLHLALGRGNISCSHLCVGEHQRNAARIYEGRFGYRKLQGGGGAAMDDLELSDSASGISNFLEQLGGSAS
jgi:ribosomal protein S18 acetylase RimI-like enzyme